MRGGSTNGRDRRNARDRLVGFPCACSALPNERIEIPKTQLTATAETSSFATFSLNHGPGAGSRMLQHSSDASHPAAESARDRDCLASSNSE